MLLDLKKCKLQFCRTIFLTLRKTRLQMQGTSEREKPEIFFNKKSYTYNF